MDINENTELPEQETVLPVGAEQIIEFNRILQKYTSGSTRTRQRIISSENWWKLRNTEEERGGTSDGMFHARSSWLHNVIVSKHADAIEAYPEPNILPREEGDKQEAEILSSIIPCVLEQNDFEAVYNDAMWQKRGSPRRG